MTSSPRWAFFTLDILQYHVDGLTLSKRCRGKENCLGWRGSFNGPSSRNELYLLLVKMHQVKSCHMSSTRVRIFCFWLLTEARTQMAFPYNCPYQAIDVSLHQGQVKILTASITPILYKIHFRTPRSWIPPWFMKDCAKLFVIRKINNTIHRIARVINCCSLSLLLICGYSIYCSDPR